MGRCGGQGGGLFWLPNPKLTDCYLKVQPNMLWPGLSASFLSVAGALDCRTKLRSSLVSPCSVTGNGCQGCISGSCESRCFLTHFWQCSRLTVSVLSPHSFAPVDQGSFGRTQLEQNWKTSVEACLFPRRCEEVLGHLEQNMLSN